MPILEFEGDYPGNIEDVFQWHERPGALKRLTPPWESVKQLSPTQSLKPGTKVILEMKVGPIPVQWEAEHVDYEPPNLFSDRQIKGPMKAWMHYHRFSAPTDQTTHIKDEIHYESATESLVAKKIERTFRYRHTQLRVDLQRHAIFADRPKLRIAISGSTGLIGTQLASFLSTGGHTILPLVRRSATNDQEIAWDPQNGTIESHKLEGIDAVIHLAGASIGEGRWTAKRKEILTQSRIQGTQLLAKTIAALKSPPKAFISMSGAGHYGPTDFDTHFTEDHSPGNDFLAELTVEWEKSTREAAEAGIRTVIFRTPMVLSARGGALTKMLPPFKMGGGGKMASGRQPMSWVSLDDLLGIFLFTLYTDNLEGPLNVGVPSVPTNIEFIKVLGRVLKRPTISPLPGFVIKTLFGEMGEALLIGGQHLDSSKLLNAGFTFFWDDLEQALRHELGSA